jgi:20S proteasome subunit alpha 7
MVEPSGVTYEFFGCAAGKGRQAAKTEMEKLSLGNVAGTTGEIITVKEAVKQLARIIYLLHDEEKESSSSKLFELEMSWVCEESKWEHVGVPRQEIAAAVAWAKESIAEEEDEDEESNEGGDVMAF